MVKHMVRCMFTTTQGMLGWRCANVANELGAQIRYRTLNLVDCEKDNYLLEPVLETPKIR